MPKIKQSPKLPPEQRRQQLLGAARNLFMKKGFRGTTTEEIARKAGLTKGALYFHFKSKEDILLELVKSIHAEILNALDSLGPERVTPEEVLGVMLRHGRHLEDVELGAYLDFWVQASKLPRVNKHLKECLIDGREEFARRLDRRFGTTLRQRRDMIILIHSLYDGLTVRRMLGDSAVDFNRQLKLFSKMIQNYQNQPGKTGKKAKR